MIAREDELKYYSCGSWQDAGMSKIMVSKVPRRSCADDCIVDLSELEGKNWHSACEKRCVSTDQGLCVHVLCAVQKRHKDWECFMKPWETMEGARK